MFCKFTLNEFYVLCRHVDPMKTCLYIIFTQKSSITTRVLVTQYRIHSYNTALDWKINQKWKKSTFVKSLKKDLGSYIELRYPPKVIVNSNSTRRSRKKTLLSRWEKFLKPMILDEFKIISQQRSKSALAAWPQSEFGPKIRQQRSKIVFF